MSHSLWIWYQAAVEEEKEMGSHLLRNSLTAFLEYYIVSEKAHNSAVPANLLPVCPECRKFLA